MTIVMAAEKAKKKVIKIINGNLKPTIQKNIINDHKGKIKS